MYDKKKYRICQFINGAQPTQYAAEKRVLWLFWTPLHPLTVYRKYLGRYHKEAHYRTFPTVKDTEDAIIQTIKEKECQK